MQSAVIDPNPGIASLALRLYAKMLATEADNGRLKKAKVGTGSEAEANPVTEGMEEEQGE